MAGGASRQRAATRFVLRRATLAATLGAVAALVGGGAGAFAAAPHERFFEAAHGAISCELNNGGGLGVEAYCQTTAPPRSLTLHADGKLSRCNGEDCIGNPPLNDPTLAKGHSVTLGPFTCRAATSAVSCTLASGAGFSISRAGVKQL
jgi:hypothetical protein